MPTTHAGPPPGPRPDESRGSGVPRGPGVPRPGRHRRSPPASRPVLLALLAGLVLVLGSGTAISLTAAAPPPPAGTAEPGAAALGAAPAGTTAPPSPTSPATPSPTPEPEPPPEPPAEPEPAPAPADQEVVDELAALEDEVTALTNAERTAAGCGEVTTDDRLRTAARAHSEDMAANDYFSHTGLDGRSPFDRMREVGYPDGAGENIAFGYPTPADVMAGWMDSDGHRRNILTCSHRTIGVGLAYDPDGRPYWTQDFGR